MLRKNRPIDLVAAQMPWMVSLQPCLYVPIAARDSHAIESFVGIIRKELALRSKYRAFLVEAYKPEKPFPLFPIWRLPESAVLHYARQIWVHVDYSGYRRVYIRAFRNVDLSNHVIDHVMNRRVARLKGFQYLRVLPVSRAVNSSHGGLSEKWAADYHSSPRMLKINNASKVAVQYADLSDIVKMLNMQGGGSLMEAVNAAQKLVILPSEKK